VLLFSYEAGIPAELHARNTKVSAGSTHTYMVNTCGLVPKLVPESLSPHLPASHTARPNQLTQPREDG
jgi:hypothetical protein